MADDNTQTTPPQAQAPAPQAPAPAAPAPERDDEPKWGRRGSDRPETCPTCGVQVERGKLGSHRFHAHGEERRAATRKQEGDDDGDDKPKTPPRRDDKAPRTPADSGDGSGQRKRSKNRWTDVRKGWG